MSRRKGFPIKLQKPRWHLFLSALRYQIFLEQEKGVDVPEVEALYQFLVGQIDFPQQTGGVKTIRVRAGMVETAIEALKFAGRLHQTNGYGKSTYPSPAGSKFNDNALKLAAVPAIERLGDASR